MGIIRLSNSDLRGVEGNRLVGGKAYQQILALRDGLPALDGVVIPTDCFPGAKWIADAQQRTPTERARLVSEWLLAKQIDLPELLKGEHASRFAVRSSATVEDQLTASFAGVFSSVLNVPLDGLCLAVFDVWRSAGQESASVYISKRNLRIKPEQILMAVLIQPMVNAFASGVAFSHPIGKPYDPHIFISATKGLADRLVSGGQSGQNYWVERLSYRIARFEAAKDLSYFYEMAGVIGRIVERLEVYRGCPQDVEFAFDQDSRFYLIQNRPIAEHPSTDVG